ncbi:MAG: response regulator transcription factor [Deltaproteobacteria bacterium]|jgi:two-component system phosphate regulon response regulator PhoB|nr:response regulator transcription factor [Deltaproteobacteria bacterium]
MHQKQILVVEDEEDILELVVFNLKKEGYQVIGVSSGEEALHEARYQTPDLIVLDLMLPGVDGFDVCKSLKSDPKTKAVPVIMLTARSEESDIVVGLELGADDYLTKPFSPRELIARIRAILRRFNTGVSSQEILLKVHDIEINPKRHEVKVSGNQINFTSTEFRILRLLADRPGWVFTRDQIVAAVHNQEYVVSDRSVDVMVVGLRKKLGASGKLIETVRGVGYRMKG